MYDPIVSMEDSSMEGELRFLRHALAYEFLLALVSIFVVYMSRSQTAIFPLLFSVGGVFCLWLMHYTVKAAAKGDHHRYPYGTGRLENISALLLSTMIAIGTMVPMVYASVALLSQETRSVALGWTAGLLFLSVIGNFWQRNRAAICRKSNSSPIIASLYSGYHTGFIRDGCSFLVIALGMILLVGNPALISRLDSIVSILLGVYVLLYFLPQIWSDFKSLADFPLPESDQIKIMAILAKHFDRYELPGRIFTTCRGSKRVFEVELVFTPSMPLQEVIEVEAVIQADFQEEFPGCTFRLLPCTDCPSISAG